MHHLDRSLIARLAQRPGRIVTCAALAAALTVTPAVFPRAAYAVSNKTQADLDSSQQQVEASAAAYNDATAKLDELQKKIESNTASIADIEAKLPAQQEKARDAIREQYKFKKSTNPLASFVLNSQSLSDFITTCVYMNEIQSQNLKEIEKLNSMQAQLEQEKTELEQAKPQLEQVKQDAADALTKAQQLRQSAQAAADQERASELAQLAADQAAAMQPATGEGADAGNTQSSANQSGQSIDPSAGDGTVNWNLSRDQFVAEWSGRINNFLAGSPLAGYGQLFAESAWNSGCDPRFSPAIACIESSKGAHCFRSHNAWGWGSRSFGSWEEAIPAHVSFLKSVYGGALTPSAARKYCPPTWQDWYNKVGSQMSRI
ncbi:hypothetical protein Corgl_0722 [Coriobacterium glomerans PW2]|uniref:Membrane-bound metallopeptidase n=1 Tax=Coriobacterium glomerans (strain ATCC 49209 / DSM 20642 / JCM 10262 / PW2) TaxID=700015 RepID=F2NBM7_CORGP|nr:glucosaminidase domain-containing protein [Coriobacterium glomerans]AEB06836.1 hypothetical protein Corgl_0722 [Coriobacterium glomerans PW2]